MDDPMVIDANTGSWFDTVAVVDGAVVVVVVDGNLAVMVFVDSSMVDCIADAVVVAVADDKDYRASVPD